MHVKAFAGEYRQHSVVISGNGHMNDQRTIQSKIFNVSVDLRVCETSLEALRVYLVTLLDDEPHGSSIAHAPYTKSAGRSDGAGAH